jgi:hypothetical protein
LPPCNATTANGGPTQATVGKHHRAFSGRGSTAIRCERLCIHTDINAIDPYEVADAGARPNLRRQVNLASRSNRTMFVK